ncbi:hypothetical protein NU08_2103 [Flavobacterium anhuiense]|uniref:Uncharacterized protein n=1 Tax=Flavobacterium anhuiense TaxID=459526 RepID=A0A444VZJ5_9FLAO|nr:hypothetical protein NU08_2103 [Flavobacterium anhuiense]
MAVGRIKNLPAYSALSTLKDQIRKSSTKYIRFCAFRIIERDQTN